MFSLERGMRYWLYSEPTDMRKSFHTLSGLVRNKIGGDPMNGDVYIFVKKRRNRIKLLHYETALDEDKRTASEALAYINKLYHFENEAKEAGIAGDALKEKRQKEAYPVILQFEKWMYETVTRSSQNSRIGKAISYTLPLLPRLSRYVNDGRFCIDNNLVENAIRPLALGRKNFLFCGNHDAAIRAAIVYSLVDSCKALDVDPREWMEDVLLRIPGNENNREALRELLPDKWAKQTN